ncbi:unnamed protein product [Aureobasidium mustum]|uniref:Rhodopsin domain-containing protein n=1 Tax=Aureobasidium mustum TaxID=2773714 RepID=A0A9N8JEE7_9PEZI|nr:unnamed protein product [Aureobasidium mustum]
MVHLLAVVISCLSLSWVSVLVRFWVKIFMIGRVRWDDWILLLAVCSCVLVVINATPRENMATTLDIVPYMFIASYQLGLLTSVCIKTSFALSLNRCFAVRWQRLLVTNMTLSFYIYAVIRIFIDLFFFCGSPGDMAHMASIRQCKHYPEMIKWWLAGSIFNAVVTWVYVLLPAFVIWTSRLSLKVKGSVSIITAVGILSGLAATFRILGSGNFKAFKDLTPTNFDIIACIVAEMAFGIIATSMTNSTKLPSMLARTKGYDTRPNVVAGSSYLEEGTIDFVKLSPIIGPQKLVDNTRSPLQTVEEFPALEEGTFVPSTPAPKTERDSWDRAFGSPASAAPARLTLIIDDISDDEEDGNKELPEVKKTFTNV